VGTVRSAAGELRYAAAAGVLALRADGATGRRLEQKLIIQVGHRSGPE
jgi:hypothetical protein